MKKYRIIIYVILVSVLLAGCLTGCSNGYGESITANNNEEEETLNMTEKEKELLLNSERFDTGKEWIESGNLSQGQKKSLQRVREMYEYLKRKYPSYDIEIKKFSPASGLFSAQMHSYNFELVYDGEKYEASIYLKKDKDPEFADNFHKYLLREEYDEMVIDLIKNNGYSVQSYTDFYTKVGEVLNEKSSVEEVLTNYPQPKRITHLFIFGEKNQEIADKIKKIMQDSIFGDDCFLYFVGDDSFETSEEYEKNRKKYPVIVF